MSSVILADGGKRSTSLSDPFKRPSGFQHVCLSVHFCRHDGSRAGCAVLFILISPVQMWRQDVSQ